MMNDTQIRSVINTLMQIRLLMFQFKIVDWGGCGDCGSPWIEFEKGCNLNVTDVNIHKEERTYISQSKPDYQYVLRFERIGTGVVYVDSKGEYIIGV